MYRYFFKRVFDILISGISLIILSPLFLVLSIMIRLNLGSPAFFHQKRPGKNEKIFTLCKFRTMTDEKDDKGNLLPDSKRVTKFGEFLRHTSLDEIPELINIFQGDMSIIGPRPLLVSYLPYYTEKEKKRHSVRPGLTGLAQVSGRNFIDWDKRLAKDVEYVEHLSILMDLRIIIMTVRVVLKKDDVAKDTNEVEGNLADIRRAKMEAKRKESV